MEIEPIIIGCGKLKHSRPLAAMHLYRSVYIRYAVGWAKSVGSVPFILSAKYGLIEGTRTIYPYTASFKKRLDGFAAEAAGVRLERPASASLVAEQVRALGLSGSVILLAGAEYRRVLAEAAPTLEQRNPFLELARERFSDGRPGYQVKLMREFWGAMPDLSMYADGQ